jgi:predicted alpha/beta-fold hydrolase
MIAAAALLMSALVAAGEKGNEGDDPPRQVERGTDGLPKYRHPYTDGLYSTVTAMNTFPDLETKTQQKIKLKVPGFRKEVQVHAVLQNFKAPLVVVLLGVDGKVNGPWGSLFPYWYNEYAYHTLTFDSTFTPRYPEMCGQGVVGNFDAEADQVAAVIGAFLKTDAAKNVVTKVGVLGMSFGGSQALLLAAKHKEGKLPFDLSGCLALSPPVSLRTAAQAVDRFFDEDRWDTTMIELAKRFGPHVPVKEGEKVPFAATEMRAAIGFVFRDGLADVVERNDRFYKLGLLPSEESGDNRNTWAQATGFQRFMEKHTFPFWQKRGTLKTVEELWDMTALAKVLPRLPNYAEAIVAANDPFNKPEELEAAKAADANDRMIVLPAGGHLGYIASDWMLVKAVRIFQSGGRAAGQPAGHGPDAAPVRGAAGGAPLPTAPVFVEQDGSGMTPDQARKEAEKAAKEALAREVPPPDKGKMEK